jgi:F-type H+-transporting ATPase subunit a
MDKIGAVSEWVITIFGKTIVVDPVMLGTTWFIMVVLSAVAWYIGRGLTQVPTKGQSIFELLIGFFDDIAVSTLGKSEGRRLLPLIVSIFVFILVSNWIGIFPNVIKTIGTLIGVVHGWVNPAVVYDAVWYKALLTFPDLKEPTRSLSTDLGMALLVFLVAHAAAVQKKGVMGYIRSFIDDPFPMKGWKVLFFWANPFFYLNLIGQVANVVSHSFRLFGNVFGGGIIIIIVSELLRYFLVPVGLFAFFGLFSGLIQAFVFSMLAVSYINQLQ